MLVTFLIVVIIVQFLLNNGLSKCLQTLRDENTRMVKRLVQIQDDQEARYNREDPIENLYGDQHE